MNNSKTQILLSINLQKGLATSGECRKTTVLSESFVSYAVSNDGMKSTRLSQFKWKFMSKGQKIDTIIRTMVCDELKISDPKSLIVGKHYKWEFIDE